MAIIPVSPENVTEYVRYCQRHGAEHDESFLPDATFLPTEEFPAYLLLKQDEVVGAAGLMRTPPYRDKGKARLTIFHAREATAAAYTQLLTAILPHTRDLRSIYGFLPEARTEARRQWEALGFAVERFVYLLAYRAQELRPAELPPDHDLLALTPADTAEIEQLCKLWNQNYRQQLGFMGATPEFIQEAFLSDENIPGGILLLHYGSEPVATIKVNRDNDPGEQAAEIGMVSVAPAYRGRGLGRLMLRRALEIALRHNLSPVYLSVNAENRSAVALYLSEGFTEEKVMVCYTKNLP